MLEIRGSSPSHSPSLHVVAVVVTLGTKYLLMSLGGGSCGPGGGAGCRVLMPVFRFGYVSYILFLLQLVSHI